MKAADQLIDLATRVADGAPIDWSTVAPQIVDASDRLVLDQLGVVERIATAYGSLPPVATFTRSLIASSEPAPATWGHLTIIRRLGSGTFADVYLARDPKLDRPVALKLLRHRRQTDAAASEVIDEARLLAKVHHPNVVTVYGADLINDRVGIWMEYIDGRTLEAEVRERGPLPPDDLVHIGRALSDALMAVHEAGLLHRDVKAQNVIRGKDGRIVLTDFGTGQETSGEETTRELGGTPLYLAPEVLNGQPATASSDVYSAGVLLYHLATQSFPVSGRSLADLREQQMHLRRSVRGHRSNLPPALARTIDRATEPAPDRRFSSAVQLKKALPLVAHERRAKRIRWAALGIAATLLVAVAVVTELRAARYGSRAPAMRFSASQRTFNSAEFPVLASAISPDGQYLAHIDSSGLMLQILATRQSQRVPVHLPDGIYTLAWLPDSNGILLASRAGVWRTSISGGALRKITEPGGSIAVSPDGLRIALDTEDTSIRLMTTDGRYLGEVIHTDRGVYVSFPTWSPDGQRIAYSIRPRPNQPVGAIESRRLDGSGVTVISPGPVSSMVWAPDGRIIFSIRLGPSARGYADLWQVYVDPTTGQPLGLRQPLWQPTKTNFFGPSLTADGKSLAYVVKSYQIDVDVADFDGARIELSGLHRVALDSSDQSGPSWSPFGDALIFDADVGGYGELYEQELQGGEPRRIAAIPAANISTGLRSPDGAWILYIQDKALMRKRAIDGPPERLLPTDTYSWVKCSKPPANVCVLAGRTEDEQQVRLRPFDAAEGDTHDPLILSGTSNQEAGWDLSADGTTVVSLDASGSSVRLLLTNLRSHEVRSVACESCVGSEGVAWTIDGKGWIVTRRSPIRASASDVIYIDGDGRCNTLWSSTFQWLSHPVFSPDGKHIAFASFIMTPSVWILRGF